MPKNPAQVADIRGWLAGFFAGFVPVMVIMLPRVSAKLLIYNDTRGHW